MISSLKTYRQTLHFVPFQLHGENIVLQPFRRIEFNVHTGISVLPGPLLHSHLQSNEAFEGEVQCQKVQYRNSVPKFNWVGGKHDYFLKILHKAVQSSEAFEGEVPCPRTQHRNDVPELNWERRNMIVLWKFFTKRCSKPHGRQRHWQTSTLQPFRHVLLNNSIIKMQFVKMD